MLKRLISSFILAAFAVNTVLPPQIAAAQTIGGVFLPNPGTLMAPSPVFVPVLIKGLKLHPENPLAFDFIIDNGNTKFNAEQVKNESQRLIKYFFAALTVPQNDFWVNLSPLESNRIIPEELSRTELGRDLLAQDYILKQLTASFLSPESEIGKKFWDRIYKEAQAKFGTTDLPIKTFNKVWIMPESATIYENAQTAYIVKSRLKVLLDQDYRAASQAIASDGRGISADSRLDDLSSQIMRDIVLPAIEKEVNEGEHFAPVRQIYHSLLLAKWYKQMIKDTAFSKAYVDQNKVSGIDMDDKTVTNQIYNLYVDAYKKGAYSFIKEDYDALSEESIPRKYFTGGIRDNKDLAMTSVRSLDPAELLTGQAFEISVGSSVNGKMMRAVSPDRAMTSVLTIFNQVNLPAYMFGQEWSNEARNIVQAIFAQTMAMTGRTSDQVIRDFESVRMPSYVFGQEWNNKSRNIVQATLAPRLTSDRAMLGAAIDLAIARLDGVHSSGYLSGDIESSKQGFIRNLNALKARGEQVSVGDVYAVIRETKREIDLWDERVGKQQKDEGVPVAVRYFQQGLRKVANDLYKLQVQMDGDVIDSVLARFAGLDVPSSLSRRVNFAIGTSMRDLKAFQGKDKVKVHDVRRVIKELKSALSDQSEIRLDPQPIIDLERGVKEIVKSLNDMRIQTDGPSRSDRAMLNRDTWTNIPQGAKIGGAITLAAVAAVGGMYMYSSSIVKQWEASKSRADIDSVEQAIQANDAGALLEIARNARERHAVISELIRFAENEGKDQVNNETQDPLKKARAYAVYDLFVVATAEIAHNVLSADPDIRLGGIVKSAWQEDLAQLEAETGVKKTEGYLAIRLTDLLQELEKQQSAIVAAQTRITAFRGIAPTFFSGSMGDAIEKSTASVGIFESEQADETSIHGAFNQRMRRRVSDKIYGQDAEFKQHRDRFDELDRLLQQKISVALRTAQEIDKSLDGVISNKNLETTSLALAAANTHVAVQKSQTTYDSEGRARTRYWTEYEDHSAIYRAAAVAASLAAQSHANKANAGVEALKRLLPEMSQDQTFQQENLMALLPAAPSTIGDQSNIFSNIFLSPTWNLIGNAFSSDGQNAKNAFQSTLGNLNALNTVVRSRVGEEQRWVDGKIDADLDAQVKAVRDRAMTAEDRAMLTEKMDAAVTALREMPQGTRAQIDTAVDAVWRRARAAYEVTEGQASSNFAEMLTALSRQLRDGDKVAFAEMASVLRAAEILIDGLTVDRLTPQIRLGPAVDPFIASLKALRESLLRDGKVTDRAMMAIRPGDIGAVVLATAIVTMPGEYSYVASLGVGAMAFATALRATLSTPAGEKNVLIVPYAKAKMSEGIYETVYVDHAAQADPKVFYVLAKRGDQHVLEEFKGSLDLAFALSKAGYSPDGQTVFKDRQGNYILKDNGAMEEYSGRILESRPSGDRAMTSGMVADNPRTLEKQRQAVQRELHHMEVQNSERPTSALAFAIKRLRGRLREINLGLDAARWTDRAMLATAQERKMSIDAIDRILQTIKVVGEKPMDSSLLLWEGDNAEERKAAWDLIQMLSVESRNQSNGNAVFIPYSNPVDETNTNYRMGIVIKERNGDQGDFTAAYAYPNLRGYAQTIATRLVGVKNILVASLDLEQEPVDRAMTAATKNVAFERKWGGYSDDMEATRYRNLTVVSNSGKTLVIYKDLGDFDKPERKVELAGRHIFEQKEFKNGKTELSISPELGAALEKAGIALEIDTTSRDIGTRKVVESGARSSIEFKVQSPDRAMTANRASDKALPDARSFRTGGVLAQELRTHLRVTPDGLNITYDKAKATKLSPRDLYVLEQLTARGKRGGNFNEEFARGLANVDISKWSGEALMRWLDKSTSRLPAGRPDRAMTTDPVGGIDMNTMEFETTGEGLEIEFNEESLKAIMPNGIQTLTPVIINVVPVMNILPLLGLQERPQAELEITQAR